MLVKPISRFLHFYHKSLFVGFISSSNLFPEPLSADEEKKYILFFLASPDKKL